MGWRDGRLSGDGLTGLQGGDKATISLPSHLQTKRLQGSGESEFHFQKSLEERKEKLNKNAKGNAHSQNRTDDLVITSDTLYH
jgi:hypothetical protein